MGARRGCAPLPPNFNPMTLMDGYMRIFSPGAIGPTLTKTDSPSEWTVRRLHGLSMHEEKACSGRSQAGRQLVSLQAAAKLDEESEPGLNWQSLSQELYALNIETVL